MMIDERQTHCGLLIIELEQWLHGDLLYSSLYFCNYWNFPRKDFKSHLIHFSHHFIRGQYHYPSLIMLSITRQVSGRCRGESRFPWLWSLCSNLTHGNSKDTCFPDRQPETSKKADFASHRRTFHKTTTQGLYVHVRFLCSIHSTVLSPQPWPTQLSPPIMTFPYKRNLLLK